MLATSRGRAPSLGARRRIGMPSQARSWETRTRTGLLALGETSRSAPVWTGTASMMGRRMPMLGTGQEVVVVVTGAAEEAGEREVHRQAMERAPRLHLVARTRRRRPRRAGGWPTTASTTTSRAPRSHPRWPLTSRPRVTSGPSHRTSPLVYILHDLFPRANSYAGLSYPICPSLAPRASLVNVSFVRHSLRGTWTERARRPSLCSPRCCCCCSTTCYCVSPSSSRYRAQGLPDASL